MGIKRHKSLPFLLVATGIVASFFAFWVVSASVNDNLSGVARERGERIPGQYIVVFKDSVLDVDTAENDILSRSRGSRLDSYRSALHGFSAQFSKSDLAVIQSDPRVAFVSEDREVSIADEIRGVRAGPEVFSRIGSLANRPAPLSHNTVLAKAQTIPTGVKRIGAVGLANTGAGVNVAVIDTGILASHPDLSGKVVGGKNCTRASGGYTDQNGHGTHVAGTIAANYNTQGVVGVAPSAKLWSVRVLDRNGNGTWSSVICGLDFVTSNASVIKVANMSLGGGGASDDKCGTTTSGPGSNDALHKAICRARAAGVTIVVAAGNSGVNASSFVPAAYDDAVITVSALVDTNGISGGGGAPTSYGDDDTFASFSNYGTVVDIGAPGVWIYSTWLKNGYNTISGTSMASPHVAGAAALYIAKNPGAAWSDVRDALVRIGEPLDAGHTDPSLKHLEPVLRADTL
ncbi:MAG: S8 family peptidase [bacterium]|nr:S8 family peptidase [bacterium]